MPFQRGNTFGTGGRRNEAAALNGKKVGPKAQTIRLPIDPDLVGIAVSAESAALAQRLMLHFAEVDSVEALYELALARLAATTDD